MINNRNSSQPSYASKLYKVSGTSSSSVAFAAHLDSTATISLQEVLNAIHNVEARRICNNIVNIESDLKENCPVRPKNSRSTLVGSGNIGEGWPRR